MDSIAFFESYSTSLFYVRQKKRELKAIFSLAEQNQLKLRDSNKVLDIGYHSSLEIRLLKEKHPNTQIIGIDVTPKKNKRIAREFKDVSSVFVMTGDMNNLEFEENYFSTIYCLKTLNLVTQLEEFLTQCLAILKNRGYLVLTLDHTDNFTPSYLKKYQNNNITTKTFTTSEVIATAKKVGFQDAYTSTLEKDSLEIIIFYKK